jgi:hypothetical protein
MHDNQENISYTIEETPEDRVNSTTDNGIADSVSVPVPDLISLCMDSSSTTKRGIGKIPKFVFIVPYRDRKKSLATFKSQMKIVLEDTPEEDYEIYISHQCDTRDFNRGAIKNIGFLVIKNKYPNHYKTITFVFNDVDTTPMSKNLINYATTVGNIKHFYGFTFTLGGIVSITGEDFEKMNGYLNLLSWGYEDNSLQRRANKHRIKIDRSNFFRINSKDIIQEQHGQYRTVNKDDFNIYSNKVDEGVKTIFNVKYEITEDNFINVYDFSTGRDNIPERNLSFDTAKSNAPFKPPETLRNRFKMIL